VNKTKIEWCDYTWNPVVGCKRGCSFCYARKIRERFNPNIPFEQIVSYDERLTQPLKCKEPSVIFVGSMSDIEYWSLEQMDKVLDIINQCPQHIFLFLTKNGETYKRFIFPKNCWLGVTVTGDQPYMISNNNKNKIFISIEPLLSEPKGLWLNSLIDWVIVGGLTPKPQHENEWVDNILKEADRLKIPVFLKNNLNYSIKRQDTCTEQLPKLVKKDKV